MFENKCDEHSHCCCKPLTACDGISYTAATNVSMYLHKNNTEKATKYPKERKMKDRVIMN